MLPHIPAVESTNTLNHIKPLVHAGAGGRHAWQASVLPFMNGLRRIMLPACTRRWPARVAAGERVSGRGAPAPGLAFIDWLVAAGALRLGATSFPRMGAAAGGLATCGEELRGDRVLHLGCGR
jgi:hypothetical protein